MKKTSIKPKTYLIKTYGCQMNFSDSERIDTVMQSAGLKRVENINISDVIIFNTCSVRQSAEDRILGLGKKIIKLKNTRNTKSQITHYKLPITLLTGCMAKRSWDGSIKEIAYQGKKYLAQLKRQMPWVDIVIQIKDIAQLPKYLKLKPFNPSIMLRACHLTIQQCNHQAACPTVPVRRASRRRVKRLNHYTPSYLKISPTSKSKITAYIPISTGCNQFCTYCIVPYARGEQIDRPAEDVINEVKTLVHAGYKDIILLGQSVNSWKNPTLVQRSWFKAPALNHNVGSKLNFDRVCRQAGKLSSSNLEPTRFLDLLKAIDNIKGNFWLTFISSHPKYFTDDLINYFAKSANSGKNRWFKPPCLNQTIRNHLRPYLNLAFQSGSNKILKKMNRKYTVKEFIKIGKKLRKKIPNLNLSTDIIVGFPGETEKDFAKTAKVMEELEFDMAYINKYSPRKGTAANLWEDNIPWKVKKYREKKLTKVLAKTALENNKKYLGKSQVILVEKIITKKSKKLAIGKTFNFKNIQIPLKSNHNTKAGQFVLAKITKATSWSLEGELIWIPTGKPVVPMLYTPKE